MNKLLYTPEFIDYNLHEVILGTEFEDLNTIFKTKEILDQVSEGFGKGTVPI